MPKSYWTRIQTPNGLKYFRADEVTDELLQKIRDEADDVFYVEYGTTTFADAEAAYLAGKTLICREVGQTVQQTRMDDLYFLIDYLPTAGTYTGHFVFSNINGYVQDSVRLTPSARYEKISTTFTTREQVMKTASAEIAPEYLELCQEYVDEDKFPIPVGTLVTYNTSSDQLQYMWRSKVEIYRNDYSTSDPHTAPSKWDRVRVSDIAGNVFRAYVFVTPYDDIKAAYDRGQPVVALLSGYTYSMYEYSDSQDIFKFCAIRGNMWMEWDCHKGQFPSTNDWSTTPGVVSMAQQFDITDAYSNQSTYSVGDLCYNGGLYRCIVPINTAENWNSAHWTQTTIADELASRPIRTFSFRNDSYPSGADIWNAVNAGQLPTLKRTQMYVTRMYIMTQYGSHDNERDVYFYSFQNRDILRLHTSNGTTWTWTSSDMYDSSLSSSGTNSVQNKTLYDLINDLQSRVSALEGN